MSRSATPFVAIEMSSADDVVRAVLMAELAARLICLGLSDLNSCSLE